MKRFFATHYLKMVYGIVLGGLVYIAFFSPAYGLVNLQVKNNFEFRADAMLYRQRKDVVAALENARETTQIALQRKAEEEERLRKEEEERLEQQQKRRYIPQVSTLASAPDGSLRAVSTAYTCKLPSENCGGRHTASGQEPVAGVTVASDSLPLGTRINIEGLGEFIVQDRFGGGYGLGRVDIYMDDVNAALQWGRREIAYNVIDY